MTQYDKDLTPKVMEYFKWYIKNRTVFEAIASSSMDAPRGTPEEKK